MNKSKQKHFNKLIDQLKTIPFLEKLFFYIFEHFLS